MTQDEIFSLRKEIRGLKKVNELIALCGREHIASRTTVYAALTPETFDIESGKHRRVIRHAVWLIQELGYFRDWDIDEKLRNAIDTSVSHARMSIAA